MASSRREFLRAAAAFSGSTLTVRAGTNGGRHTSSPAAARSASAVANDQSSKSGRYRSNWGRWGADDERGAVNLITPAKRAAAAALVRTGRTVSLARSFTPPQHYIRINRRGTGHSVVDYYGFEHHGVAVTHLDALCHMWDQDGMWNGRDPVKEIDTTGAGFADIMAFGDAVITRGVLLDVPGYRKVPHVTIERPIDAEELSAIADRQGVDIGAGDALFVYGGRESFVRTTGRYGAITEPRPGLRSSCARFVRDRDVSLLGWDMHDAQPDPEGSPFPVHHVLYTYGVALLDNALLEPLARVCAEENRYEFMFMALPLKIPRGTGSPVNPIALF
jgi:kynurenine formamidase